MTLDLREGESAELAGFDDLTMIGTLGVVLYSAGEVAQDALLGLAFAQAMKQASQVIVQCPGLLPSEGLAITTGESTPDAGAQEIWEISARLALAMASLTDRDGVVRVMPETTSHADVELANIVLRLLTEGQVVVQATGIFEAPLPSVAATSDVPTDWLVWAGVLPSLCGVPTNLTVQQTLEGAKPLAIIEPAPGVRRLRCEADQAGARMILELVSETEDARAES